MSTFCHITGSARNLPKPHYFPLLPPISPAEAKKLCRITGRSTGPHLYSPIIALGKTYTCDGLEGCKITKHESLNFVRGSYVKYKDNEKSLDSLLEVLDKMKIRSMKVAEIDRNFVYHIEEMSKSVVVPSEFEEAIRTGEIESLGISKDSGGHLNVKLKSGRTIKVLLEVYPQENLAEVQDTFHYGKGQSQDTLENQKIILDEKNARKKQTLARRQLFEQKDRKAEEDERRALERPKSKKPRVKFNPKRRKEKLENMERIMQENRNNKAIILPPVSKVNPDEQLVYEQMLADVANAHKKSVNVTICICMSKDFDWLAVTQAESEGFDWNSFPHEDDEIIPAEIEQTKEIIDIPVPDSIRLDIAATVELICPVIEVDKRLLRAISEIKEDNLRATENISSEIKRMNYEVPTIDDINAIVNIETLELGFMIDTENGKSKFVRKEEYVPGKDLAISGALIKINNVDKFVCGQIVTVDGQDKFVAGQTIDTSTGKRFVPGQTIISKDGLVQFLPGQCVDNEDGEKSFMAGQTYESKFIPGQMVDRGDSKPVFMSGHTVTTEDGPKFVPGELIVDKDGQNEFIPGIKLPTVGGNTFVPGQAFQSDEGLSFTPGQIIDTEEGPSFIPGQSFKTPDGHSKFIKGDLVKMDDGKMKFEKLPNIPVIKEELLDNEAVIPNEDLQLVSVQGEGVLGFAVHPSNTANVQCGEKLYGDIIETESSVLFYLFDKLPTCIPSDAKIISGQLIVGEISQRFIPGKMMATDTGERFVPGQMVRTNHGEEFVPGQIVESKDGPKFVPGQLVIINQTEKFIPGQVIMELEGPKFVPGQIIHTENGATFIPGQVMSTEEGQKFVPGQLVETKDGPRFVPGRVIESDEGPKFIPGTVIETDDGLKYVPIKHINAESDDSEEDSDISFQGFDVSPEELQLLSLNLPEYSRAWSPITMQNSLIDSDTLKRLAVDTMFIHGRTPEPTVEKKTKKKKKKGKVIIDAPEDDDDDEEAEADNGTNKVEILNYLIKAGNSLSIVRKGRELKKVTEILCDGEYSTNHIAEVEAIKFLMLNTNKDKEFFNDFFGDDHELMAEIILLIGNIDTITTNDQAKKRTAEALREIVTNRCDKEICSLISKINEDPENLFTDPKAQILLTEAVGIVCVTGDVEVASLLERFISDPSNPNCLKEDKDVLAVLRQLLVLHRIAEQNPDVAKLLQNLQINPEGVKDRNRVRKLIKTAKLFLTKDKGPSKPFDIRHVTSSKDIPTEVFKQIREDKDEAMKFIEELPDELFHAIMGDQRFGDEFLQSLSSSKSKKSAKELDKFKKGMAIVVTKEDMQAVIPRHFARSVCYGIIPYILIDEEGYKFFERGLTGRKLAPSRVIENTWYQPDSFYEKAILYPKRVSAPGMQYEMVFLGDAERKRSMNYTSLVPLAGPTMISYDLDTSRNLSRNDSPNAIRKSGRFSPTGSHSSSLHDSFLRPSEVYHNRTTHATTPLRYCKDMSPTVQRSEPYEPPIPTSKYEPYVSNSANEDTDTSPIARSGTVGKLLDKYSNFSVAREFGYHNPKGVYSKYNAGKIPVSQEIKEEADSGDYTEEDKSYLPSRFLHRTSFTPEKSTCSNKKNKIIDEALDMDYRPYQSKYSDIYESEETEVPAQKIQPTARKQNYNKYLDDNYDFEDVSNNMPRSSLSKKSSYDQANNRENLLDAPVSSYVSRLKDWKNKQEAPITKKEVDDNYEPLPRKFVHNRYETALTGDEDSSLYETTPYSSALRKKYGVSLEDDGEDEDNEPHARKSTSAHGKYGDPVLDNIESRHHRKGSLSHGQKYDDPEFDNAESFRKTVPIYGDPVLDNVPSYQRKSAPSYKQRYDDLESDDIQPYQRKNTPANNQRYDDIDDEPKEYNKKRNGRVSRFLRKSSLADQDEDVPIRQQNKYEGYKGGNFNMEQNFDEQPIPTNRRRKNYGGDASQRNRSNFSFRHQHDEIENDYSKRQPYGYNMLSYGNPMPDYNGGVPWGILSKSNDSYSGRSSYMDPCATPYSAYDTGLYNNGGNMSYGPPRRPYGASSYGSGTNQRKYANSYDDLDDDDGDELPSRYDHVPPKDQRNLASKIARKYATPADVDDE